MEGGGNNTLTIQPSVNSEDTIICAYRMTTISFTQAHTAYYDNSKKKKKNTTVFLITFSYT